MGVHPDDATGTPPGEGMRRALLLVVCGVAVAVAVVFSPTAGLWNLRASNAQLVSVQP
jgi:hypothetical protein